MPVPAALSIVVEVEPQDPCEPPATFFLAHRTILSDWALMFLPTPVIFRAFLNSALQFGQPSGSINVFGASFFSQKDTTL